MENEVRYDIAHWLDAYKGIAEGSAQHMYLVDLFNGSGLCGRYTVKYTDAWCAVAFCDPFIALGLSDFIPVDCGCYEMIKLSKEMGIWVEDDAHVPGVGDGVLYDWQDNTGSRSDNVGDPDHIGIVQTVDAASGVFTVIEGNYNDTVKVRTMQINGTYIRGFICPDYKAMAEVYVESGVEDAGSFDSSIAGTYVVTAGSGLNIRKGAGTDMDKVTSVPYGTPVRNYGYYTVSGGVKWLFVQLLDGRVGYACGTYLAKGTSTGTTSTSAPSYTVGSTYTVQVDHLAVRSGAGASYAKKAKSQLTSNGQANAYSDGCLKKGTRVTCQATRTVSGDVWMQIPSGWIAAYYDCEKYVK